MLIANLNIRTSFILPLLVSSVSVLIFMIDSSGWIFEFDLLYLWAILPYLVFCLIGLIMEKFLVSPKLPVANNAVAWIILLITLFGYIDALYIHTSSTSSLLFVYLPIYLLVGSPLILLIVALILNLVQKQ